MNVKEGNNLLKQIEELRTELVKHVDQAKGNFVNQKVLMVSTALDKLITEYQRSHFDDKKEGKYVCYR